MGDLQSLTTHIIRVAAVEPIAPGRDQLPKFSHSSGTAVYYATDGTDLDFLTCKHVVANASSLAAHRPEFGTHGIRLIVLGTASTDVAVVRMKDPRAQLALLRKEERAAGIVDDSRCLSTHISAWVDQLLATSPLEAAPLAGLAAPGRRCWLLGFPLGQEAVCVRTGTTTAVQPFPGEPDRYTLQYAADGNHGDSGGVLVVAQAGKFYHGGVIVAGIDGAQNVTYALFPEECFWRAATIRAGYDATGVFQCVEGPYSTELTDVESVTITVADGFGIPGLHVRKAAGDSVFRDLIGTVVTELNGQPLVELGEVWADFYNGLVSFRAFIGSLGDQLTITYYDLSETVPVPHTVVVQRPLRVNIPIRDRDMTHDPFPTVVVGPALLAEMSLAHTALHPYLQLAYGSSTIARGKTRVIVLAVAEEEAGLEELYTHRLILPVGTVIEAVDGTEVTDCAMLAAKLPTAHSLRCDLLGHTEEVLLKE